MSVADNNPFKSASTPIGIIRGGRAVFIKRLENSILIGAPVLGTIAAPFWFAANGISWIEISAFFIFYAFCGIGVGIGLHRYFTHKGFEAAPVVPIILGIAGSMSCQGSIARWVVDHRRHHVLSDQSGDTHSPYFDDHGRPMPKWRGLLHAHIGWMFDNTATDYEVYGKDLLRDPVISFFHRTYWLWPAATLVLPWLYGYFLGGPVAAMGSLLLAGFVRVFLFQNIVWAVNSIAHSYGEKPYPRGGESRNHAFLAMLTFGDGWHNNHHRHPRSAFHGFTKNQLDINGEIISWMERVGLARNVVRIRTPDLVVVPSNEGVKAGNQSEAA